MSVTFKPKRYTGQGWRASLTHCKNGHEFTEENTYLYKQYSGNFRRMCKTCALATAKKTYARKKALLESLLEELHKD